MSYKINEYKATWEIENPDNDWNRTVAQGPIPNGDRIALDLFFRHVIDCKSDVEVCKLYKDMLK